MRQGIWLLLALGGMVIASAIGSQWHIAYLIPDFAVIVLAFLVQRREPIPLALLALALGYVAGQQSVAPPGVCEFAMLLCATVFYFTSGKIAGAGPLFFALMAGATVMLYHATLFILLAWVRGRAGFATWATAALLPSALVTAIVAFVCYPVFTRIEAALAPVDRAELRWH